tara:strand:+ start:1155 stop:1523 length:369 start_codon:yes stop_codon:yes gene_type:complete
MTDLRIPRLNSRSKQYLFKNKLISERKSKRILLRESFIMTLISIFLIFVIYQIPNKLNLLNSFNKNIKEFLISVGDIFLNLINIFAVLFLIFSILLCFVLLLGAFYRIFRVIQVKKKKTTFH